MKDNIALVTGAATGIGRETACLFAEKGAKVVVVDVNQDEGNKTVKKIKDDDGEAIFIKCDISQKEEVKNMIAQTVSKYGKLDYAVNNAGIEGENATLADCSSANWEKTIDINLKGTFYCMKYEIKQMLGQKKGSIVNVSSVAGLVGFAGLPAYTASKHGMNGLTKTAALEYATKGIRVNAICPGVIKTEMVERVTGKDPEMEAKLAAMAPMERMGNSREVAASIVWLCSDSASFVTGTTMTVDGGFVAR